MIDYSDIYTLEAGTYFIGNVSEILDSDLGLSFEAEAPEVGVIDFFGHECFVVSGTDETDASLIDDRGQYYDNSSGVFVVMNIESIPEQDREWVKSEFVVEEFYKPFDCSVTNGELTVGHLLIMPTGEENEFDDFGEEDYLDEDDEENLWDE